MNTVAVRIADSDFAYTARRLEDESWNGILDRFTDASIFQTIPFGVVKSSAAPLEHLVLWRGSDPIAAAQVRLMRVPLIGRRIAYVLWGPLWDSRNNGLGEPALAAVLNALRQEYVVKRRFGLRITPRFARDERAETWAQFERAGFGHVEPRKTSRTIVIDLRPRLEDLRKGLDKKWRNCLSAAEKNGLELVEGHDDAMFDLFLQMYRQMLTRKGLAEPGDIRSFRAMQSMLPERFRMNVMVALTQGEPCAGAICSAIGSRGLYLFGATANSGMRNKASYLVQWRAVQWLKAMNCTEYDLHGSNAQANPGVYAFKMGLCGRNGREIEFAGNFEAHYDMQSQVVTRVADLINHELKRVKTVYAKYWGFQ